MIAGPDGSRLALSLTTMSPASVKLNSKKTIQYSLDGFFGRFASGWKRLSAKDAKAVTKALRERGLLPLSAHSGGTNLEQCLENLVAALPQVAQTVLPVRFTQSVPSTSLAVLPVATVQDDDPPSEAVLKAIHLIHGKGTSAHATMENDVHKNESLILDKETARVRLCDVGITHIWGIDKDEVKCRHHSTTYMRTDLSADSPSWCRDRRTHPSK